jgi:hypothetical protein
VWWRRYSGVSRTGGTQSGGTGAEGQLGIWIVAYQRGHLCGSLESPVGWDLLEAFEEWLCGQDTPTPFLRHTPPHPATPPPQSQHVLTARDQAMSLRAQEQPFFR